MRFKNSGETKECREELARRDQGSPRGLARTSESARTGEASRVRADWLDQRSPLGGPRQCESAKGWWDLRSPRVDGGTCGVREWMTGPEESADRHQVGPKSEGNCFYLLPPKVPSREEVPRAKACPEREGAEIGVARPRVLSRFG